MIESEWLHAETANACVPGGPVTLAGTNRHRTTAASGLGEVGVKRVDRSYCIV
jgi:hypothetical protein